MSTRFATGDKKAEGKSGRSELKSQQRGQDNLSNSAATDIGSFQRTIGNQAVLGLLRSGACQAKLTVSHPDDIYEQEADRVADEVMRMPSSVIQAKPGYLVQKKGQPDQDSEISAETEDRINAVQGGGQSLPESLRSFMEPRFGADFSHVRVHTDAGAGELARSVNAHAFTVGKDIVFGHGEYAPHSDAGRMLLAHELTHVVQQGGGRLSRAKLQREEKTEATAASTDPSIEALDLDEKAKKAAYELKKKHPTISFTSGRRTAGDQARAMAANIVSDGRKWIENTYSSTTGSKKLQKWVDDHPKATTAGAIGKGLEEVMNSLSDAEKGNVSKHIAGAAFDVQPQTEQAEKIKADIQGLPGITKFLEKEGGLVRWHAQFKKISNPGMIQRFKDPYHEKIMISGLKDTALESTWQEVYFGSWLRDFSQLIESGTDPTLKKAIIFVLNSMAKKKFNLGVTEKRLGQYSAAEHMDNPSAAPPATDRPVLDSIAYIVRELDGAVKEGRTTEGRIHFGQALHATQDFFSHTNFTLNVVRLCEKPGRKAEPLVSGAFGDKDKQVSLLEMLVNYTTAQINWSQFSPTPQERVRQWMEKHLPLPEENRMPDMLFEDPRLHPENKLWFEALDVLKPRLEQARKEAVAEVKVPTHSELHQDDPSRPRYPVAFALAEYVTHELSLLMDQVWSGNPAQNLQKISSFIRQHLRGPEQGDWWKKVLSGKGVLKCK